MSKNKELTSYQELEKIRLHFIKLSKKPLYIPGDTEPVLKVQAVNIYVLVAEAIAFAMKHLLKNGEYKKPGWGKIFKLGWYFVRFVFKLIGKTI